MISNFFRKKLARGNFLRNKIGEASGDNLKEYTKTTFDKAVSSSGIPMYPHLIEMYKDQKEDLLGLQQAYLENPYSRRRCREYYTALYHFGYERQICEDVGKMSNLYYLFFMDKHFTNISFKYTNGFSERILKHWKNFGNIWFVSFVVVSLYIQFHLGYVRKTKKGKKLEKKEPEPEEDTSASLLSLLPGNFQEKVTPEEKTNTRFRDVIGIDEYKSEVESLVDFLKNPKRYEDAGAELPKGLLLTGKPGVGKTLLARALAGEANCSFFYKSGSDFSEMFVGLGALRVKQLFKAARKHAPSIIFIDEIDSVAGKRNSKGSSSSRSSINQVLTEMDGFKPNEKILVIAATNFPEALDPAIKRPGRFDKLLEIPLPDKEARVKLLDYYISKIKTVKSQINVEKIAGRTTGMTGADMKNLVNLAILNAIKEKRLKAIHSDFEYALDRLLMGVTRKSLSMDEKDKMMTAYHEGGHTLMTLLTDSGVGLHKATILPAGSSLGHTAMIPKYDNYDFTVSNLKSMIDVAMGGRVAEEIIFGDDNLSTGCSNDLEKATEMANEIVRNIGYYSNGAMNLSADKKDLSEKSNAAIDREIEKILRDSLFRTRVLMKRNKRLLDRLARKLFEKETMTAEEIKDLLGF